MMLGSDYPFSLGEAEPGTLVQTSRYLTDEQKIKLRGTNAIEFFGLADAR